MEIKLESNKIALLERFGFKQNGRTGNAEAVFQAVMDISAETILKEPTSVLRGIILAQLMQLKNHINEHLDGDIKKLETEILEEQSNDKLQVPVC